MQAVVKKDLDGNQQLDSNNIYYNSEATPGGKIDVYALHAPPPITLEQLREKLRLRLQRNQEIKPMEVRENTLFKVQRLFIIKQVVSSISQMSKIFSNQKFFNRAKSYSHLKNPRITKPPVISSFLMKAGNNN